MLQTFDCAALTIRLLGQQKKAGSMPLSPQVEDTGGAGGVFPENQTLVETINTPQALAMFQKGGGQPPQKPEGTQPCRKSLGWKKVEIVTQLGVMKEASMLSTVLYHPVTTFVTACMILLNVFAGGTSAAE